MYTYSSVTASRISAGRNRNLAGHATTRAMGPVTTTLLLAVIIGVLALLYLTQITKTSVYGYQVSNLSTERKVLTERQQQLQVEAARLQSIANIQNRRVVGSLTPQQSPQFVNP